MTARATKPEKVRFTSIRTYLEPDIFVKAQAQADQSGETVSTWLRGVVIRELLSKNKLTKDDLIDVSV